MDGRLWRSFQNMNEEQTEAGPGQPGMVRRLFVTHQLEDPAVNRELDEAWRKVHQVIRAGASPGGNTTTTSRCAT